MFVALLTFLPQLEVEYALTPPPRLRNGTLKLLPCFLVVTMLRGNLNTSVMSIKLDPKAAERIVMWDIRVR